MITMGKKNNNTVEKGLINLFFIPAHPSKSGASPSLKLLLAAAMNM